MSQRGRFGCLWMVLLVLGAGGCGKKAAAPTVAPQALIFDEVHNGGPKGFFWLPPLVPQPHATGNIRGDLSPVVRIDEIDKISSAFVRTVATFTTTTGPGSETVRIGNGGHHYIVNWHTGTFDIGPAFRYRITVLLNGRSLGLLDVEVVAGGNQLKNVDSDAFIGLVDGKTLPIKFLLNACAPVVCAALDSCHSVGVCNADNGACTAPAKADGAACSDGNACTQTDACAAGVCAGGNPVVCAGADQCHDAGTCNNATGACTTPAKADGTACNDGNACTQTDACSAGGCTGGNPVVCAGADQCHDAGICNNATGVCTTPVKADGMACSDGNACTQTDACSAGVCAGGNPVVCAGADQCHDAGICNNATGACTTPAKADGTACSDGNACTQTDACSAGLCAGGNPVVCAGADQCHEAGICNNATGVCTTPVKADGTACSDGNACTQTDACSAGVCAGGNPVVCSTPAGCSVAAACVPSTGICTSAGGCSRVCGDGVVAPAGRPPATVDFVWLATSCEGPQDLQFTIDGVIVAQTQFDGCTCDSGIRSITVPFSAALPSPQLGSHVFGAAGAGSYYSWVVAVVHDGDYQQDVVIFDAVEGGASTRNPYVCSGFGSLPLTPTMGTVSAEECDDGNTASGDGCSASCQIEACGNGRRDGNEECDDGNTSVGDGCSATCVVEKCFNVNCPLGTCQGSSTCDPGTGQCVSLSAADGTACSDGDLCTTAKSCVGGACVGGVAVVCAPPNSCWENGRCLSQQGCVFDLKPIGTACGAVGPLGSCIGGGGCYNGSCVPSSLPDGVACDDGNGCTVADACQSGGCAGSPRTCPASACHEAGSCNASTGQCVNPVIADGTTCDDGNVCTGDGACSGGVCQAPPKANGTACDDGDSCRAGDTCQSGTCTPVAGCQGVCGDGVVAPPRTPTSIEFVWLATCSGGQNIQFTIDGVVAAEGPADDGFCSCVPGIRSITVTDVAVRSLLGRGNHAFGIATAGYVAWAVAVVHEGDNSKEVVIFDAYGGGDAEARNEYLCGIGYASAPVMPTLGWISFGEECDDGNTVSGDGCSATCAIEGCGDGLLAGVEECDDGNTTAGDGCTPTCTIEKCFGVVCSSGPCQTYACDPGSGACVVSETRPDGESCDDTNLCTTGDVCGGGSCIAGPAVVCAAPNSCQDLAGCNPGTGECSYYVKPDGVACSDGNSCTGNDMCLSGVCQVEPKADGASCDDGNLCTVSDICSSGLCQAGTPLVCAAPDQCHVGGTCDPQTGQCVGAGVRPDGEICSDGTLCNGAERCGGGICESAGVQAGWHFDETEGTQAADIAGAAPGHIQGATFYSGRFGGALWFKEGSSVRVPHGPTVDVIGTRLTLAAWIRPTALQQSGTIVHKDAQYSLHYRNGHITYADSTAWSYTSLGDFGTVVPEQWNHVAAVLGGGRIKLYVNGALVADRARPGAIVSAGNDVLIDCYGNGQTCVSGTHFQGQIDEVGIWKRALNEAEIATLASGALPDANTFADDKNGCTADSCDPLTGVHHTNLASGTSCSDGNLCRGLGSCDNGGTCLPGPLLVFEDGNPCTAAVCDPVLGAVQHVTVPTGTSCDDGNGCNGIATCTASGTCQLGIPVAIDDGNSCTSDSCSPQTGVVTHVPPPAEESGCIFPDLTIEGLATAETTLDPATLNLMGSVSVTVKNRGPGAVHRGFSLVLFEDKNYDRRFDADQDTQFGRTNLGTMVAGETRSVLVAVAGPVSFPGNLVAAYVDTDSVVPENDETNNYADTTPPCIDNGPHTFKPAVKWSWAGSTTEPRSKNIMMAPAVADINRDGRPDVVFVSYENQGRLRVLDGQTGNEIFTASVPVYLFSGVAVGDIDNDGFPEIIATDTSANRLLAFEHDGTLKWRSDPIPGVPGGYGTVGFSPPSLADLDGDGRPEIVVGGSVLDATGRLRWTGTQGQGQKNFAKVSVVVDLDLDGAPEVVAGRTAYRANGAVFWTTELSDGYAGVGNFDADAYPELVLVGVTRVSLLNHDGTLKWSVPLPGGGFGGAPTVADMDGDGVPEIGVAGANQYVVFGADGVVRWSAAIQDLSSSITGSTVFDFDGDGSAEVVYGDERFLRIYRGRDGALLWQTFSPSGTLVETPLVADVDGDGKAEIVKVSNSGLAPTLEVLEDSNDSWVAARKVWNQNSYHITNVNDDLTIPVHEMASWQQHNTYRVNAAVTGCVFAKADLVSSFVRTDSEGGGLRVTARVGNAGSLGVRAGVWVSFYAGNPAGGGVLLGRIRTVAAMPAGAFEDVAVQVALSVDPNDIWASADDEGGLLGSINEIDELNNLSRTPGANLPPLVNAGADRDGEAGMALGLAGGVSDDGLPAPAHLTTAWTQVDGPATAAIATPGSLTSMLTFPVAGTYVLRLSATDGSLTGQDDISLTITAAPTPGNEPNRAPTVSAGPDQRTAELNLQVHAAASDDGKPTTALSFQWSQIMGPATANINSPTSQTPILRFLADGIYKFRVVVSDGELVASDDVTIVVTFPLPDTNERPLVYSNGDVSGLEGDSLRLSGFYSDDGRPYGGTVVRQWRVVYGPGTVVFDSSSTPGGSAILFATFGSPGDYLVELDVNDGELSGTANVFVTILPRPNRAPIVSAGPDQTIALPTAFVMLTGSVADDGKPVGGPVSGRWTQVSGPGLAAFGNPQNVITTAAFDAPGTYVLRLTANDTELVGSDDVMVTVVGQAPVGSPPVVSISSPTDLTDVTAPTDVVGTVTSASLLGWRLETREVAVGAEWKVFGTGDTPQANAILGRFDPTLLLNGVYEIRLTVTDQAGRAAQTSFQVVVKDNFKVGHFTLTFEDMAVPVAGIPIQLFRTYDSRDAKKGDFGAGWTLDVNRIRVHETGKVGNAFRASSDGAFIPTICLVLARPMVVTVTNTDGRVHKFEPRIDDGCALFSAPDFATVSFHPLGGTSTSLDAPQGQDLLVVPGENGLELLDPNGGVFDPTLYELTFNDGRKVVTDQIAGFKSIVDLNDNQLFFSDAGILHSSGKSISFARDTAGRIISVLDPMGKLNHYAYNADGDLVSYTDRAGNVTRFVYDIRHPHYLRDIIDARGVRAVRNEYDADGRLISTTDGLGKTINFSHDINARHESYTDRNGKTKSFDYDERGNVTTETDAEGGVTTRTFDARNNRLTEADGTGRTRGWVYDAQDNVVTETDPAGKQTHHTYGGYARLLSTTDPLGHTHTMTYDNKGNVLTETGAIAGQVTSTGYDASGNPTRRVDALGAVTTFAYDMTTGYKTSETDARGHTTTYAYDANGRMVLDYTTRSVNVGSGSQLLRTDRVYDNLGREIQTTDPSGAIRRKTHDALGKVILEIDPAGRTNNYEYDAEARLVKHTYPDGTFETSAYDNEGRRISSVDRAGRTTTYAYDGTGRPTTTTFADGVVTARSYEAAGRVLTSVDPARGTTTYEYDPAGRQSKVIDALGNTRTTTYDDAGRQTKVKDARGNETTFAYDAAGQQTVVTFADGTQKTTTYDLLGRSTAETDQLGRTTQFGYDVLGRMTTVKDALLQVTTYAYDQVGNRTRRVDAAGRTTVYDTDQVGREVKRTLPGGVFETKDHDQLGNLAARTDFMGRRTTFGYDVNNRLLGKTYPDATSVAFRYSATGRRLSAQDARGVTSYQYDNRDRVTKVTDPAGRSVEYGYDSSGRGTSLSVRVGAVVKTTTYGFDSVGRIGTVTDPDGRTFTQTYDETSSLKSLVRPNGVDTGYSYDSLGRLSNIRTFTRSTNTTVASYAYTVGATGLRTRIDEADGTSRVYAYDPLQRLTGEAVVGGTGPQYNKTFAYDAVSNRVAQATTGAGAGMVAYTYDPRDRLLTEGATAYTWDDNGNQRTNSGGDTYAWDFEDRLVRVTKPDGTVVDNTYDVDGVLVRTVVTPVGGVAATTTDFVVDTSGGLSHIVAEVDGAAGAISVVYVRAGNMLLEQIRAGVPKYPDAEGIGSVRTLLDATGGVADTYRYTAFGEDVGRTGTDANPYQFAGERNVGTAGLYQNRARWLSTGVGAFVSIDPEEGEYDRPITFQPYLYAGASPGTMTDPTGRFLALVNVTVTVPTIATFRTSEAKGKASLGAQILTVAGILVGAGQIETDSPDQPGVRTLYHYTKAPYSRFLGGIISQTSVTDLFPLAAFDASERLGIPLPNKVIFILDKGNFIKNSPFIVLPNKYGMGGGTDYYNPVKVPGSQLRGWRTVQ